MEQPKNTTDAKLAGAGTAAMVPEVTWAQRSSATEAEKNHVFLAIMVPDVSPETIKLDVQPGYLDFTGYSESKKANYHVKLDLYKEIDPSASKTHHTSRSVEFVLQKKDLEVEFWPRLLKDAKKVHVLKTDFDKWVDEDEQDEVGEDDDYMSKMGGMQGMGGEGGMGGMGGMGGEGGFGGIDFSKLGGMGGAGMPDMSSMMGGMGGMGDDGDDDDDDDEMPELEDEEAKGGAADKPKIEEVA